MTTIRSLNEAGIARFSAWISAPNGSPPREILTDDVYTDAIDKEFSLDDTLRFETSFELGKYLFDAAFGKSGDRLEIRAMNGMWAWISLTYIDSLLSRNRQAVKPLASAHYIDGGARLAYRLIARTAWELYLLHGEGARIALSSKKSPWGELSEQMTGANQRNFSNRAFWSLANTLYIDEAGEIRSGAASKRPKAARQNPALNAGKGSVRRLAATMKQFERTYNVRIMSVEQLAAVLPPEYRKWLPIEATV